MSPVKPAVLRLYDFSRFNAAGANAHALACAVDDGMYRAKIDVPTPLGHVVGVANPVSRSRTFAAEFAYLCHL
jgi:hypothetical protein